MIKKTAIILLLLLAAQYAGRPQGAVPTGSAFAQQQGHSQENGQPCPPECVTDSMEIITYYPSPYGYYEELRGDKIIVGDTDNSHIDETHLPPSGTLTFEPKLGDPTIADGNLYEGSLYYQGAIGGTKGKFRFYDGSDWQDVGGGGDGVPDETVVCTLADVCSEGWFDWKEYNLAEGNLSVAEEKFCSSNSLKACVKSASLSPGVIISGSNSVCPVGYAPIYRKWRVQTCGSNGNSVCGPLYSCSTSNAWMSWGDSVPQCNWADFRCISGCTLGMCSCCYRGETCISSGWSDVYCSKS